MRNRARCGFSLIEVLIVISIILVIVAIASVNLLSARRAAREASASASVRSVTTAQLAYAFIYGSFAEQLGMLGPPPAAAPASGSSADLLDASIACPAQPCTHNGYALSILAPSSLPARTYFVVAGPAFTGGVRSFCSSERSQIVSVSDPDPQSCIAQISGGDCADERNPRCRR